MVVPGSIPNMMRSFPNFLIFVKIMTYLLETKKGRYKNDLLIQFK